MIGVLEMVLLAATVGAGLTVLWFLYLGARRSPLIGFGLVLGVEVLRLFAGSPLLPEGGISLTAGPVSLYPGDIVSVALALVVAERLLSGSWRLSSMGKIAVAYLAVSGVSLVAGIIEHDVFLASNQFRKYFSFATALAYFATHPAVPRRFGDLRRWWVVSALGVAAVAVLRWLLPLDGLLGPMSTSGPGGVGRPIDAALTLFLLLGAVLALSTDRSRWVPTALLGAVVAFQHRSVWVAALVALAVLATGPARRRVLPVGLAAAGATAVLSLALPATTTATVETLSRAASSMGTFEWRVEGWRSTLASQLIEPHHWLIGRTMGTPWERDVFGRIVEVSPHSMYVELLLRVGVVGLLLFLAIFVALARAAVTSPDRELAPVALAVLTAVLVYNIVYSIDPLQGALLGLLWARLGPPRRSVDLPAPELEATGASS